MARANGITRQAIIKSIKSHGTMTADELARELGISQVAVRQHLASLEADHLVSISVDRRGLGRPSHRYRLTPFGDETFPRSYDRLANEMLSDLREWQGEEALQLLQERMRARRQAELRARLNGKSLQAQLHEIAQYQTQQGFMAEVVDAGDGKPILVQHNCAVCSVARSHPDICCRGDIKMIEELLGNVEIVRESSILSGDHTCAFRINVTVGSSQVEPTRAE